MEMETPRRGAPFYSEAAGRETDRNAEASVFTLVDYREVSPEICPFDLVARTYWGPPSGQFQGEGGSKR